MVTNARGTSPSPEKEKELEDIGLVLCGWETKNAVNMLNYEHNKNISTTKSLKRKMFFFLLPVRDEMNSSLSLARDKTKRHLSLFLYQAQNLPSLLFYMKFEIYKIN